MKGEYQQQIKAILVDLFDVNDSILILDNDDALLTSPVIGLQAHHLVYLFFEVEKIFGFRIDANLVEEIPFNSINNISNIIDRMLQEVEPN